MKERAHGNSPASDRFAERLRHNARRLTGPRLAIVEVLRSRGHPLSIKEMASELRSRNCACDLATIYRSMHLLETMQMVKRYDLGGGMARFELLGEGEDGHHHHLVCTRCSQVVEIDECFSRELESRIAAESGFSGITHRLEFFGICPQCQ